jgi:hypothetical protein
MVIHIHVGPPKNGARYAEIYTPQRVNGKKVNNPVYLGRVIDLDNGIFYNRKRGYFRYTIESGFEDCDIEHKNLTPDFVDETHILDFGSVYLLEQILRTCGYYDLFLDILDGRSDTLMALLFYRILENGGYSMANDWLEGSYAKILFPKAQLKSQRISDILTELGGESVQRRFFQGYLNVEIVKDRKIGLLIDSTGLPNDIDFYLTAVNNHNGKVSRESRLILVVDSLTKRPLFFRYNPGNVPDVSTLKATIDELKALRINMGMTILDAGYCSDKNIIALCGEKIPFLTRMASNRKQYKQLVSEHGEDVLDDGSIVRYPGRLVGIRRYEIVLPGGENGFAFVAVDHERRHQEWSKYTTSALEDDVDLVERKKHTRDQGFFVLISSEAIESKDILPLYYTRQTVEQIFDVSKNDIDLLPLRVHSEKTLRGHLFLVFLASLTRIILNEKLMRTVFNATNALLIFRNLKCKIYDETILIKEPVKKMNDIASALNISIPNKIVEGKYVGN